MYSIAKRFPGEVQLVRDSGVDPKHWRDNRAHLVWESLEIPPAGTAGHCFKEALLFCHFRHKKKKKSLYKNKSTSIILSPCCSG